MRDPASHIESIQENKKFAEDLTSRMMSSPDDVVDYKFAVSIPKGENYFPVLRYKCVNDLRPVPIVSSCDDHHVG